MAWTTFLTPSTKNIRRASRCVRSAWRRLISSSVVWASDAIRSGCVSCGILPDDEPVARYEGNRAASDRSRTVAGAAGTTITDRRGAWLAGDPSVGGRTDGTAFLFAYLSVVGRIIAEFRSPRLKS